MISIPTRLARSVLVALLLAPFASAQSILTYAGGGTDDGRPASSALIYLPHGLLKDAAGNLLISDFAGCKVRRIDVRTGIISTVAGTGQGGFKGDGGPATLAYITPWGIAFDGSGNLYVVDSSNHRVRKIASGSGIITTVAGSGAQGFGGDGGPATAAKLNNPSGMTIDAAGNLYVVDSGNHRVRRIAADSGIITTVVGRGGGAFAGDGGPATSATLATPRDVTLDSAGNLYVTDSDHHRVRRVDATTGIITTVAGNGSAGYSGDGGPALSASLNVPYAVKMDAAGNLYICELVNNVVRKVAAGSGIITTVAGTGQRAFSGEGISATSAALSSPRSILVDNAGILYIGEGSSNKRVRKVDGNGIITTVAGGTTDKFGDGGPAIAALLDRPDAIAFDAAGNLYSPERFIHRVRRIDAVTGIITTVAGTGVPSFSGDGGPATSATLDRAQGVAFDAARNLYVSDSSNCRIRRVAAATGIITTVAGSGKCEFSGDGGPATNAGLYYPYGLVVDSTGNLYIADSNNNRVRKVAALTGIITTVAGNGTTPSSGDGGPATAAGVCYPRSVALDAAENLYIADNCSRIRKVSATTGIITSVPGSAYPLFVAFDRSGNLYASVTDTRAATGATYVQRMDAATGLFTTVAGDPAKVGYSGDGDGGPAIAAGISPAGLAVDDRGNLYLGDGARLRVVYACVTVSAPAMTSPSNGVTGLTGSPALTWGGVRGAFRYDVYLSTTNPPALAASDLNATTFAASNLTPGTTYYWKVVAKGDPYCSPPSTAASEIRSFATAAVCTAPGTISLTQPADGATGVASSAQLSWQSASGAATYDLYLGTSNPPLLYVKDVTVTTWTASSLTPNTTYYWNVAARASCDATKATVSTVRAFRTAGVCAGAGTFNILSPTNGSANVPVDTTLTWLTSANASSYDVYLGTSSPPPLYLSDVLSPRVSVSGLAPGQTYFWRVVAKVACDATKNVSSTTYSFGTSGVCTTPPATSITFVPPGNVGVGQTYTVAWNELPELGADGYYVIERSTSSSFNTILDSQQSFSTSASFLSTTAGTYYHRVRGALACDPQHPGPVSAAKSVNVVAGTANVIFTVQPQAVITALGDRLEDQKASFALENLGTAPLQVIAGSARINSPDFFDWRDRLGGDPVFVTLDPKTPRIFDLGFHGPANDTAGAYQGVIFVASTGQGLAITPYAFVNLKVGGGTTGKPVFQKSGTATEYAFFPGISGDDTGRAPITIDIANNGTTPMELGAEIAPEVWLAPEPGWNASAIPAGASRTVRLSTRRSQAPNGSALPRYTYFTVRSRSGQTARLLVQDNDAPPTSLGRTSLLNPGSRSFIIPSVVSDAPQMSRLRLTNVGSDSVQTDLFYTPSGSDGFNATTVRRATIVIPPNDVVTLTDPLVQVFGATGSAQGQVEVRTAPEKIGFLVVSSSVLTPQTSGGAYSYELPTLVLGEGARLGSAHTIAGVSEGSSTRTSLIVAETSGIETTRVRAVLSDSQGTRKGEKVIDVPRYGQLKIDNVVTALGGSEPFDGGRIDMTVESGGGSVGGVVTILDAARNNGAVLVSQPSTPAVSGTVLAQLKKTRIRASASTATAVAPVVVNSATQRTTMGFAAAAGGAGSVTVTCRLSDSTATVISKTIQLPASVITKFDNVMEDLFGLTKGQTASGSVFISAGAGAQIYAWLGTLHGTSWSIGSGLPIVATVSDVLTSLASKHPLYLDGLEQSIDSTRGTSWDVNVNEIGGASGTVLVRLYEAGNRSLPIAEKRYTIAAYQQLKLSTVFASLGLDSDERRKERTNVLCAVSADSGSARASAVGISTDDQTGDTRHYVFSPTGGVPSTGVLRVSIVTAITPTAATPGKRRAVVP